MRELPPDVSADEWFARLSREDRERYERMFREDREREAAYRLWLARMEKRGVIQGAVVFLPISIPARDFLGWLIVPAMLSGAFGGWLIVRRNLDHIRAMFMCGFPAVLLGAAGLALRANGGDAGSALMIISCWIAYLAYPLLVALRWNATYFDMRREKTP